MIAVFATNPEYAEKWDGWSASSDPQYTTDRLLRAAILHPGGVVFGEVVRHQRLTLQQRAISDSHMNGSKGKEIPELTTRSGFREDGYLIAFG